jgi:hypothetical protein
MDRTMPVIQAYDVSAWSATAYTIIRTEGWCGGGGAGETFVTATARSVRKVFDNYEGGMNLVT